MKRTLDVMVVPVDREPELKTLESDENGSFLKALQRCVGGLIEPLSWLFDDAPAGYCNEEGALGATFLDANRAVYADKAMEDAGFLSQLDFATPVREGDLYAIVFGDMVFTGFDPETGESRDIPPPRNASASASASAARAPSTRARASSCPSPSRAGSADEASRTGDAAPKTASWHLPLPPGASTLGATLHGTVPGCQGPRKTFR